MGTGLAELFSRFIGQIGNLSGIGSIAYSRVSEEHHSGLLSVCGYLLWISMDIRESVWPAVNPLR